MTNETKKCENRQNVMGIIKFPLKNVQGRLGIDTEASPRPPGATR